MAPLLDSLPNEMQQAIIANLPIKDICSMRKTSRLVCENSWRFFREHFSSTTIVLERNNLTALIEISKHPKLRTAVKTLAILFINTWCRTKLRGDDGEPVKDDTDKGTACEKGKSVYPDPQAKKLLISAMKGLQGCHSIYIKTDVPAKDGSVGTIAIPNDDFYAIMRKEKMYNVYGAIPMPVSEVLLTALSAIHALERGLYELRIFGGARLELNDFFVFDDMCSRGSILRRLQSLTLHLCGLESDDDVHEDKLVYLLRKTQSIENLHLDFKLLGSLSLKVTLPLLKGLTVNRATIWCADFNPFLLLHKQTLKAITLTKISFFDNEDDDYIKGMLLIMRDDMRLESVVLDFSYKNESLSMDSVHREDNDDLTLSGLITEVIEKLEYLQESRNDED